jgi:glyoxylase-like metal-dependent hydrolase (beta-lactamase superfamily II)
MNEVAPGIVMIDRFGPLKTATWILYSKEEAAVVEMPPYSSEEEPPHEAVAAYVKTNRLKLKYAFLSHPHWDHCQTFPHYREEFRETCFIGHSSFFEDLYFLYMWGIVNPLVRKKTAFDQLMQKDFWAGELNGEPLYAIHAPKHSPQDILIVFRGAMITGDWCVGDLKDCNDLVDKAEKVRSIDRVMETVKKLNYNIHMLFSVHGDCLFYDVDFYSRMEESKIDHQDMQIKIQYRSRAPKKNDRRSGKRS